MQGMGYNQLDGLPGFAAQPPHRLPAALGMLGGLSAEQLRGALQEPRTANYIRQQLEAEDAYAAKIQLQQQVQVAFPPFLYKSVLPSRHNTAQGVSKSAHAINLHPASLEPLSLLNVHPSIYHTQY